VLSQQRAAAVTAQLITMGIDASRLSSKGFGDTKPMADNSTLEGKANNRRVEFVKQ
jgi:outer membrane protein OmpA-like peptidoglycan-associated protein